MGIKQLYNDNFRKLPNEYGDVSVMYFSVLFSIVSNSLGEVRELLMYLFVYCVEVLKESFDTVSSFLLKLNNRLFSNGEYPRLWGEGIIVPIFKGGNLEEAGNYRG